MTKQISGILVLALSLPVVTSRLWNKIPRIHDIDIRENYLKKERTEEDPFEYVSPTTPEISDTTGIVQTDSRPCDDCREINLADYPESYPTNPEPSNPPRNYFSYDVSKNARFGPGYPSYYQLGSDFHINYENNAWGRVQKIDTFDYYWDEFGSNGFGTWKGVLANHNMDQSVCSNGNNQSPIDVRLSGVACVETHQIRHRPGDFHIEGSNVRRQILSSKLRLLYDRRPCDDLSNEACKEPDPPFADFPNGWSSDADTLHVDFKIPAEHQIYGEKFDAEMQIYHLHPGRRLMPAISILFRVEADGHNTILQQAIDAFQHEYDIDEARCAQRRRRDRRLVSDFHSTVMGSKTIQSDTNFETWGDFSTQVDDPAFQDRERHARKLTEKFNPYHSDLMRNVYFYGYDGSLTEPPCTEIVSWFIMDEPAIMSQQQLAQMKHILFSHVDRQCQKTSVHFEDRGVARPIQDANSRMVWHCTSSDFPPDSERPSA